MQLLKHRDLALLCNNAFKPINSQVENLNNINIQIWVTVNSWDVADISR